MTARDLMGERKRTGQFMFKGLIENNSFLSINTLNANLHIMYLLCVSINSIIHQTDIFYSKFNTFYNNCEKSCTENTTLGGLTQIV
jgi:hypothetical protein